MGAGKIDTLKEKAFCTLKGELDDQETGGSVTAPTKVNTRKRHLYFYSEGQRTHLGCCST